MVVDEGTGERGATVVRRESVGYNHHWIGSTVDRNRLPGDTSARVAGNLRPFRPQVSMWGLYRLDLGFP
jgi:hypothetical protein